MIKKGFTIWFTGLSGAGKTTISDRLVEIFTERKIHVEVLDGDVVRTNLSKGLGFSKEDRDTNIKRIAFVCKLLTRNGAGVIAAAISPYREIRAHARTEIKNFVEVYVKCPLEVCEDRDVKGLYAKARAGEIKQFTGIDDPYEDPPNPEITLDTVTYTAEENARKIVAYLVERGFLLSDSSP